MPLTDTPTALSDTPPALTDAPVALTDRPAGRVVSPAGRAPAVAADRRAEAAEGIAGDAVLVFCKDVVGEREEARRSARPRNLSSRHDAESVLHSSNRHKWNRMNVCDVLQVVNKDHWRVERPSLQLLNSCTSRHDAL